VHAGELTAVMGPSGSGKSTLLHIAGGLDTPTAGQVLVEDRDLATLSAAAGAAVRRRSVGYVFQDLNLLPSLSAVENVALPRELDGVRSRLARREAVKALEEVGVADLAHRFPDEMSGGQQQRVAIARALVGPRRLLLADEPTGALDSATGEEVLRVLRGRCEAGAAGVLVTHEARHAAWADRVVFLRDGVVVDQSGPIAGAESLLSTGGAA
jgi:putative ABC transport system ATP-binding protein